MSRRRSTMKETTPICAMVEQDMLPRQVAKVGRRILNRPEYIDGRLAAYSRAGEGMRDKRSHWFTDIEAAARFVESVRQQDVYMGYGLSPADYGPAHRCLSADIMSIAGAWADLDLHSEAHNTKPLPHTIEDALTVLPSDLPPTIVLRTGNGVQVWWVFQKPEVLSTANERDRAVRVMNRLHTLLRLRAGRKGWSYDRLSDLARVVRIPGTVNGKHPGHPKDVEVYSLSDRRYSLSAFEQYLESAGIPGEDDDAGEKQENVDLDQQDLRINLEAAIRQEVLELDGRGSAV